MPSTSRRRKNGTSPWALLSVRSKDFNPSCFYETTMKSIWVSSEDTRTRRASQIYSSAGAAPATRPIAPHKGTMGCLIVSKYFPLTHQTPALSHRQERIVAVGHTRLKALGIAQ